MSTLGQKSLVYKWATWVISEKSKGFLETIILDCENEEAINITKKSCVASLKGEELMPTYPLQAKNIETLDKAEIVIILCLWGKVLREFFGKN